MPVPVHPRRQCYGSKKWNIGAKCTSFETSSSVVKKSIHEPTIHAMSCTRAEGWQISGTLVVVTSCATQRIGQQAARSPVFACPHREDRVTMRIERIYCTTCGPGTVLVWRAGCAESPFSFGGHDSERLCVHQAAALQSQTQLVTWPITWQRFTSTLFRSVLPPGPATRTSLLRSCQLRFTVVWVCVMELALQRVLPKVIHLAGFAKHYRFSLVCLHVASVIRHLACLT